MTAIIFKIKLKLREISDLLNMAKMFSSQNSYIPPHYSKLIPILNTEHFFYLLVLWFWEDYERVGQMS